MKLPRLNDIPPEYPRSDLHRSLEAMLAGLRCEAPDGFLDDLEETTKEVERLLVEIEGQGSTVDDRERKSGRFASWYPMGIWLLSTPVRGLP